MRLLVVFMLCASVAFGSTYVGSFAGICPDSGLCDLTEGGTTSPSQGTLTVDTVDITGGECSVYLNVAPVGPGSVLDLQFAGETVAWEVFGTPGATFVVEYTCVWSEGTGSLSDAILQDILEEIETLDHDSDNAKIDEVTNAISGLSGLIEGDSTQLVGEDMLTGRNPSLTDEVGLMDDATVTMPGPDLFSSTVGSTRLSFTIPLAWLSCVGLDVADQTYEVLSGSPVDVALCGVREMFVPIVHAWAAMVGVGFLWVFLGFKG